MTDGRLAIAHGKDAPVSSWEALVKNAFNLQGVPVTTYEDEHERMLPSQPQDIQKHLGIETDLGLQVVDTVPDQDDEELT